LNLRWLEASGCRLFDYGTDAGRSLVTHHARDSREAQDMVLVDALLGTGSRGSLRTPLGSLVADLNRSAGWRIAVDLPTGLDSETGSMDPDTFRADHTCTFVAPKPGLLVPAVRPWVGQLHVMGIGVPREILKRFGVAVPEAAG